MTRKNYTISDDTYATNPGNSKINPLVWMRYDVINILRIHLPIFIIIFLSLQVSYVFIFVGIPILYKIIFYWIRQKEHFQSGDSNGGIVVSVNPNLVAVTTDLTKGFGEYPVVKIIKCYALKNVQLNDYIPTVALYTPGEDDNLPHWIDFNPIPLSFATSDRKVLQSAMNSYTKNDWRILKKRIDEINKPFKVGLYKVDKLSSNWSD